MKIIGFIIILIVNKCLSINGIVWNKRNQSFVPIFSRQEFKKLENKIPENDQDLEKYNFNGEKLVFLFYDDKDVFEFYDNDLQVTGICGDLWTLLAEYLNFTMVLNKTKTRLLGIKSDPNENYTGLLGMLQNNENMIIPAMEAYIPRLEVADFTMPFWKTRHRTFIKSYHQYKTTWMIDLFAPKIWFLILIFYLSLSIVSILAWHTISVDVDPYSQRLMSSTTDYFFYNFAALCNQGDVLYIVQKNFKIQSFCISLFSWLLITAFSSQLIIFVTRTDSIPPFNSLESLINDTDYILLSEKNSIVYISFEQNYRPIYAVIKRLHRIKFYTNYQYMWNLACSDSYNYAVLQNELMKMNNVKCKLDAVGMAYIKTWVVAGMPKNFKYKRTIDISLMKLHEFGIINVLKARWIDVTPDRENAERYYAPITLNQISLLLCVYLYGLCSSIILVLLENVIYEKKIAINSTIGKVTTSLRTKRRD